MTLEKSSLSTFWLTFRSAIKGNFIFPLLNLIVLILVVPVSTLISFKNFTDPYVYTGAVLANIADFYKFYFSVDSLYLHVSVIAFSILLGIFMFRFITNKIKVNVFYSLGITRKNLFTANSLAGILMLFVSISIPFLAGFIINILKFGYSSELLSSIIYNIVGYTVLATVAFSVAAAVLSCVGTIIEGVSFTTVILAGPTMIFYCIESLMKKLTLGSPFGIYSYYNPQLTHTTNPLIPILSKYNPILFLYYDIENSSGLRLSRPGELFPWIKPDYSSVVTWCIISGAIFIIGMHLFKKRKAEICGFIGVNKWLNFAVTFLIGFFPFCLAISYIDSLFLGITVGLAAYIIFYLIIDITLKRNTKEFKKGLVKLPVHIGVSLLILLIFATGLLGYSSRVPSIDEIESAEINPITYAGMIDPINPHSVDFDVVDIGKPIKGFKSERDLKTITDIHWLIVETGKLKNTEIDYTLPKYKQITDSTINIIYHLKNGKNVRRYYSTVTMEIIDAMLEIDETDRYKQLLLQNLTEPVSKNDSTETVERKNVFQSGTSTVSIVTNDLGLGQELSISSAQRIELLNALSKDLTAQTVKQRYYPKHPALGAIQFYQRYGEIDKKPIGSIVRTTPSSLAREGNSSIIITDDMANTLDFLNKNGFTKLFKNDTKYEFISAQVIVAKPLTDIFFYGNEFSLQFKGKGIWDTNTDLYYGNFSSAYKVTNRNIIEEIEDNASISYFRETAGYYVLFNQSNNGGYTTMYVPASKMPQSVIDGVANFKKD
jgi:hypothetical protein